MFVSRWIPSNLNMARCKYAYGKWEWCGDVREEIGREREWGGYGGAGNGNARKNSHKTQHNLAFEDASYCHTFLWKARFTSTFAS